MDDAKLQLADKLRSANTILVTVSRNPSVDQLSALLGLTLALNKQGKHAAAVFSGEVPSTIEFLQPEETFEKNTDSLRDFIIALDKNKADKLRYKVEDDVVRIFITPYKTSISQEDFEFSQGDFNVELVVALGVQQQDDLDEAITAHGRILHDATVTSISTAADPGLGSINWRNNRASSLSEMVTDLVQSLDLSLFDEQISTALLTGIVSETDRFSNDKTASDTMSMSAILMSAGANQQLVASKLSEPAAPPEEVTDDQSDQDEDQEEGGAPPPPDDEPPGTDDGTIEIAHEPPKTHEEEAAAADALAEAIGAEFSDGTAALKQDQDQDETSQKEEETPLELPEPDETAAESTVAEPEEPATDVTSEVSPGPRLVTEPPTLGGTLTANSSQPGLDPVTDPLSLPVSEDTPILSRSDVATVALPDEEATPERSTADEPSEPELPELADPAPSEAVVPEISPDAAPAVAESPATAQDDSPTEPQASAAPASVADAEPEPLAPLPFPTPVATPATPPSAAPTPEPFIQGLTPPPPAWVPPSTDPFNLGTTDQPQADTSTLADLEQSVESPHLNTASLDDARDEVNRALNDPAVTPPNPEPIQALNAQPLGGDLHSTGLQPLAPAPSLSLPTDDTSLNPPSDTPPNDVAQPGQTINPFADLTNPPAPDTAPPAPQVIDTNAPPPVPPPIPFQFGNPPQPPQQ